MTQHDCSIEDVIARARRGDMSAVELRRLQIAVQSSRENRLLYEAGLGFASEGSGCPDDDLLVAKVAERVSKMATGRSSVHPARTVGLVLAGLSLVTAAAAAGWAIEAHIVIPKSAPASAPNSVPTRAAMNSAQPQPLRAPVATDPKPLPVDGDPMVPNSSVPASVQRSHAPAALGQTNSLAASEVPHISSAQTDSDAAALFAEANRARRAGDSRRALELYRHLVSTFPSAAETEQSRLAAAELLLQSGDWLAALEAFRSCQGGATQAEALWGMARALRALNRTEEERELLRQLTRQSPESAYAEAARQLLERQP